MHQPPERPLIGAVVQPIAEVQDEIFPNLARLKKLLKDKLVSEDDERQALDEVQKLSDAHIAKLDAAFKSKEKEIMEIR